MATRSKGIPLTLNLNQMEHDVLANMSLEKDMSKSAVMRQALRLLQHVDRRLKAGEQMAFINTKGEVVRQVAPMLDPLVSPWPQRGVQS